MGLSILALPFGIAANLEIDTALLIATTIAELKLTEKISGDSLAFRLIAIIQPIVKFPGNSLSTIFKNIDLNQLIKLNDNKFVKILFQIKSNLSIARVKFISCKGIKIFYVRNFTYFFIHISLIFYI